MYAVMGTYGRTVVVGAGAGGRSVPGGLGGEPAGVVGSGGGGVVVGRRTDGGDEHGEECHKHKGNVIGGPAWTERAGFSARSWPV